MRVLFTLIILISGSAGASAATLGAAEEFVAHVLSGKTDLERFDFARAGYWKLPQSERMAWLAKVAPGIFGSAVTSDTCDQTELRRFKSAMWIMVLTQSPDAATWSKNSAALRSRLHRLDRELERAAREVKPASKDARVLELHRRVARDQVVRNPHLADEWAAKLPPVAAQHWGPLMLGRMMTIDCDDTEWLKIQLAEIGWFDIPTYGKEADDNAWLLVQHADRDRPFQRRMLDYLQALPAGRTASKNLAYLADRLASGEGKPQRYGTQGTCQPDGSWKSSESEDPAHLDERRASVGMAPIAEHSLVTAQLACGKGAR